MYNIHYQYSDSQSCAIVVCKFSLVHPFILITFVLFKSSAEQSVHNKAILNDNIFKLKKK